MTISRRLMLGALFLTVISVFSSSGITGWFALHKSSKAIEDSLTKQFQSIASSREDAITRLFEGYGDLLQSLSHSRMTQEALYGFVRPFDSYRYEVPYTPPEPLRNELQNWYQNSFANHHRQLTNQAAPFQQWLNNMAYEAQLIQRYYLAENPAALSEPERLIDANDSTIYGQQHKKYHSSFRDLVLRFGFNDLMLIDRQGERIVYTVRKGPHLGTSLRNGPFRDSALANLVASLREKPGELAISQFRPATYRYDEPVIYMAISVRHDTLSPDKPTGYLIAEIPANTLSSIVTLDDGWEELGLGETGQAFLVSPQKMRVTSLRSTHQQAPVTQLKPVQAALTGKRGIGTEVDGLGQPQMFAWQPVRLGEQDFALIVQQSPSEVFAGLESLRANIWASALISSVVLVLFALLLAWYFARRLSLPLTQLTSDIDRAARELNLTIDFKSDRQDEIGIISRSLSALFASLRQTLSEVNEATRHSAETAQENAIISSRCRSEADQQRLEMSTLDAAISQTTKALDTIGGDLSGVGLSVKNTSELAEHGRDQVGHVAVKVDELRRQVLQSDESMEELTRAADSIVAVVDTIQNVAEQTNLLALNAAIEAARAGEYGRGFAVVADEVRRLSANTHEATGEIQALVDRLRHTVASTAEGLKAEQISAQACTEQSRQAETSLGTIYETVTRARQVTDELQLRSKEEHDRAGELHRQLETMVAMVENTDAAISQLADSAIEQRKMTENTLRLIEQITV